MAEYRRHKPLAQSAQRCVRVAAGNLTIDVSTRRTDEFGDMMRALEEMIGQLRRVVGKVRTGVESVNVASGDIAQGNADLSARTEQQASGLKETAASMEQVTTDIRQSADSAKQATQLAHSAAELAGRGGALVSKVVEEMHRISTSSKKIEEIVGLIDGIAFQTNILALNAAVGAARAGD